jgi:hypothetical protein
MDKKNTKVGSETTLTQNGPTYTLPNRAGAVHVCLIREQTVAIIKDANVNQHYETMHKSFAKRYLFGSNLRKSKVVCLCPNFITSTQIMSRSMTEQEKCTEASSRFSWVFAKHMKPFFIRR